MPLLRRRPPGWDEATPDEDLVEWTRRGEREAFGILYDRHHLGIYGYCYRCLGEREAAQDATGETFGKALGALASYRSRSFRSWLFSIAHNVIVDDLRARRAAMPLDMIADLSDPAASPEDLAVVAADADAVLRLLPQLSADQRDAVALRLAGLSPAEIGEVLGKSRAAVDMTLYRATLRLRAAMGVDAAPAKGVGRRD